MTNKTEQLFNSYYQDVYRYLYSLCRDASLSEDLASEVFVEVVRSIGSFRGQSDIKTWLFSIARHRWFRHLRKQKLEPDMEILSEFLECAGKLPEQICIDRATAERAWQLLSMESQHTQQIVTMRLEGYSFYEIGHQFGISENSARVIEFRAKAKIRRILEKEELIND